MIPSGLSICRYRSIKRVEVSLFRTFFIWGSGNVIQISEISFSAKNSVMSSIFVRRNATFAIPFSKASLAPVHIRAPFISTPIKFFSGYFRANPTAYSPFPHPNSRTIGLLFLKKSEFHFPFISNPFSRNVEKGNWNTWEKEFISSNFCSLFLPINLFLINIKNLAKIRIF
jgi:hypothetical protein